MLRVENLTKYFGEVHAVDNVSFTLEEGGVTSVVGPNGAGKTTLINLISGAIKPDAGRIYYKGRDITGYPPSKISRIGIARSFQIPHIFLRMTVLDNILIPLFSRKGLSRNLIKRATDYPEVLKSAEDILGSFGLWEKRNFLANELPHGDRKLLDIAMALAMEPELVLLDEPTSGVSIREKSRIMEIVEEAIRERGVTALIVEHDMDIVFSYSEKIIVMHQGKILAMGSGEEIKRNKEVESILMGGEV